MKQKIKPPNYWTKEKCREVALECKSRTEFKGKHSGAYRACYRNGWLDELCSHMDQKIKPPNYWTKENCKQAALECKTQLEFYKKHSGAHNACYKNKWMDEVCSHMEQKTKPPNYWTKEKCREVALKCKTRREFYEKHSGAYGACYRNGWLDEVCSHTKSFNDDTKSIYALEFSNKVAYIGLSIQPLRRFKEHIRTNANGCVRKYIDKHNNEIPTLKILCEGLYDDNVGKKENDYIEIYKQNGFKLLNLAPAGSLGNQQIIWTKEKCKEAALECKSRSEFRNKHKGAYAACLKNKWMDEVCSHMEQKKKLTGYWTKENCKQAALKCKTRREFYEKHKGAHNACYKNGWLDELCSHIDQKIKLKGYWTKERCREAALKCKSRIEFKEKHGGAYTACHRNKWLDEVCSHMDQKIKPPNYWTKENCKQAASKCKSRSEFCEKHGGAYHVCLQNNWMDEVCSHMEQKKKLTGYWTKERCREAALKCKTRSEFCEKHSGAHNACYRNGWLDEVCSHMKQKIKPPNYWTKENCKQAALKCKSRTEFKGKHGGAYHVCYKNGWLDELCSHVEQKTKPPNYWTKEKCREAALECKTRLEFYEKHGGAHNACYKNKWLDEVCSHMEQKTKPPNYWTKENCKQTALKCKTRSDFYEKHGGAYRVCLKNNWMDELCSHMEQKIKLKGYWTKEKCREAALECKSRSEFCEKHGGAYNACYKNKWLDEVCSHMNITNKSVDGGIL